MKIGIIGAMDCEVAEFCTKFNAADTNVKGIKKGEFCGHEIYISLCGIGKVNSAASTQKMIDMFCPDVIINSGVAGAVNRELHVLDIVVSECFTYHDFSPIDILDRNSPYTSVFKADKRLVELSQNACKELSKTEKFNFKTGMIVSGDMFVSDSNLVKQFSEKYNAMCCEMEGAAIAHVCLLNEVPFVAIRALSDNADEEAEMSFEDMCVIAAKRACFVVANIIENI